jgi:hypothetical protein
MAARLRMSTAAATRVYFKVEMASNTEDNKTTTINPLKLKEIVEVPRNGPLHQCKNVHVVCNRCKLRLVSDQCPSGRGPIVGKSLKIEQLLDGESFSLA